MASSTPTSSPTRKEQHNPHPYPIKTSHTGLLTRSNSSKAHGSWSKHHYTPVPPSPSAFVFDPPEANPGPMRRRHVQSSSHVQPPHASPSSKSHNYESPRGSERSGSMSPSPSKYSRSWVGRNSEGEQVNLPRHPYLWNPAQLAAYLSSELYGSDGEPLEPDVVKTIVEFMQQRKIGGRAFLNLDQEDFQEMEGVDSLWSNVLWDASSTLREGITPYRPSRISSSGYKRGRVRGVVDLFERSASESSDVGEDEARTRSPGKVVLTGVPPAHKHSRKTQTQKWKITESEDKLNKLDIGPSQHNDFQGNTTADGDREDPVPREPYMDAGTSTIHNVLHDTKPQSADASLDLNEFPTPPPGSGTAVNDNLAVVIPPQFGTTVDLVLGPDEFQYRADNLAAVIPPQSDTPVDLVLGPDKSQYRADSLAVVISPQSRSPVDLVLGPGEFQYWAADSPEPDLQDDNVPHNREVETVSIHPQEISEPTMAELYEQTYGAPPPSSRKEQPRAPPDEGSGETEKVVAAATSSDPPPTALRPVVQRRAASPPPSLRHLFIPSSVVQTTSDTEPRGVYILSASDSVRDEAAVHTLSALKERLAIVERRLEAMELKDVEVKNSNDEMSHCSRASRRVSLPIDLSDLDLEVRSSQSPEAPRSWQSAYILLAGATTGVSMVLIPMLLRHLWSRW